MSKLESIKGFFGDVVAEVKKTTWPAKDELMQSTLVVIISIFLLGGFVAVSDKIVAWIIGLLTG